MRRLFWQMNVALDGFMEAPNREWKDAAQVLNEEFERNCTEMLKTIDAILPGRVTDQRFAGSLPSAAGPDADRLNELPGIVFSRTLDRVEWKHSSLVKGNVAKEVEGLKRQPGQDAAFETLENNDDAARDRGALPPESLKEKKPGSWNHLVDQTFGFAMQRKEKTAGINQGRSET